MPRALRILLATWLALLCVSLPGDALTPGQEIILFGGGKNKFANSEVQVLGTQIGVGLADTGGSNSTNLATWSQYLSGPPWQQPYSSAGSNYATVVDNATTLGDGLPAASMTEVVTGGNVNHSDFQIAPNTTTQQYTFSAQCKKGAIRTRCSLQALNGSYAYAVFDVNGGQIGVAETCSGWTCGAATISGPDANGFYLCSITFTVPSSIFKFQK